MGRMMATLTAMGAYERRNNPQAQADARSGLVATLDAGVAARIETLRVAAQTARMEWEVADVETRYAQNRAARLYEREAPDSKLIEADRQATWLYGCQLRLAREMREAERAWREARAAAGLTGVPL